MSQKIDPEKVRKISKEQLDNFKNWILPPPDPNAPAREDIPFMPTRLAAFFLTPPRASFLIIRYTLILLVLCILWAAFSTIDEITVGEGKIIPSSQVQVIQNLEGGIIAKIPVKIGEIVEKDQIVMQLDETRFASSAGESKAKTASLQARAIRLTAESTGTAELEIPADLEKENPQIIADERALFASRKLEQEAATQVLQQQVSQRNQELVEKRSRLAQLQQSYSLINKELQMSKPLADKGVVSEVEILRLQRQVTDIRGEMDGTRLAIPRLQSQLSEVSSKLNGAQSKFRSDAANELAQVKAELAGTTATGMAAEDRLARTTIRSPVKGIIKTIKINTLGGVIQPGMDVMEIVPLEDNLLVEVRIRPSDIGFLRVGQTATVKISAYDYSIYGGLDAVLDNITADSITNEKGESFYLVRVRTDRSFLGTPEKPLPIIPGMMATAHIKTGSKSILSYMLKPILKAKTEALRER